MINIMFRRDKYTTGPKNQAWATIDGHRYEIPPKTGNRNNGGAVYRLIVKLCDAGYSGEKFMAWADGRPCLRGVLDKRAVPVDYGGVKQKPLAAVA